LNQTESSRRTVKHFDWQQRGREPTFMDASTNDRLTQVAVVAFRP